MRSLNIKNIAVGAVFGFAVLVTGTVDVDAQTRRDRERERQRIERLQERERQRQRNVRTNRNRRDRIIYDNRGNGVIVQGQPTYAAPSTGYQYGYQAGVNDRRSGKYNRSNVYRNTGSRPNAGDPTSADYRYRQAYLEGYNDGFNGRRRY